MKTTQYCAEVILLDFMLEAVLQARDSYEYPQDILERRSPALLEMNPERTYYVLVDMYSWIDRGRELIMADHGLSKDVFEKIDLLMAKEMFGHTVS
jgi:hypothetical protein